MGPRVNQGKIWVDEKLSRKKVNLEVQNAKITGNPHCKHMRHRIETILQYLHTSCRPIGGHLEEKCAIQEEVKKYL